MCHCARDVVKMMIECWAKLLIFTIILATMAELAGASMPHCPLDYSPLRMSVMRR